MAYTIKELADKFNVSKQAIRKQLEGELVSKHVTKKAINGVTTKVIDETGYELLRKHYEQVTNDSKQGETNVDIVSLLKEQLETKDKQIDKLQNMLDQAQRLQLVAENKVKQIETSTNDQETSDPEPVQEADPVENNQPKKKLHWWQRL